MVPKNLEVLSLEVLGDSVKKAVGRGRIQLGWNRHSFPRLRYLDLFVTIRDYKARRSEVYRLDFEEWIPSLEHLCISNPMISLPKWSTAAPDFRHPPPGLLSLELYADTLGRIRVPPSVRRVKFGSFSGAGSYNRGLQEGIHRALQDLDRSQNRAVQGKPPPGVWEMEDGERDLVGEPVRGGMGFF